MPYETDSSAATTGWGKPKKKWTVMVFMGAGSLPDVADLSDAAMEDIKEMENVHPEASGGALNIFVQLYGNGVPTRRHIGHTREAVPPHGPSTGAALIEFIKWSLLMSGHTPEDYSLLVLWGHAYRFAISPAETGSGIDALDFAELANVLEQFQKGLGEQFYKEGGADVKLDILGFDSCDLAMIEMTSQLYRFADYLLCSQMGIPLPGWPYDKVLDRLRTSANAAPMSPRDLGTYIVRRFCEDYGDKKQPVSLTLLNLTKAEDVFKATEELAENLAIAANDQEELELIHRLFYRSQTWEGKPFVDVADLCLNLWRYCGNEEVARAAAKLGDLLIRPIAPPGATARKCRYPELPFVVEHGRNSHETARLQGVSLYAPHVAANHDWEGASYWYKKFVFANATVWGLFVQAMAQPD